MKRTENLPPSFKPLPGGVTPSAVDLSRIKNVLPDWVDEKPPTSCLNPDYPERSPRKYLVFRMIEKATGRWFSIGESVYPVGEVVEWDFSLRGVPVTKDNWDEFRREQRPPPLWFALLLIGICASGLAALAIALIVLLAHF